jgi:hypothetical protein
VGRVADAMLGNAALKDLPKKARCQMRGRRPYQEPPRDQQAAGVPADRLPAHVRCCAGRGWVPLGVATYLLRIGAPAATLEVADDVMEWGEAPLLRRLQPPLLRAAT